VHRQEQQWEATKAHGRRSSPRRAQFPRRQSRTRQARHQESARVRLQSKPSWEPAGRPLLLPQVAPCWLVQTGTLFHTQRGTPTALCTTEWPTPLQEQRRPNDRIPSIPSDYAATTRGMQRPRDIEMRSLLGTEHDVAHRAQARGPHVPRRCRRPPRLETRTIWRGGSSGRQHSHEPRRVPPSGRILRTWPPTQETALARAYSARRCAPTAALVFGV
jgi:hypothetical protein